MKKQILNFLKSISGLLVAVFFLYFTFRNKPINEIVEAISKADLLWLFLGGLALFLVTFLRAIRWKILIDNTGHKAKSINVFLSLLIGYFVNSFTPKFGEIVRCTTLQKSDKVPISKNLGTVVSERIYDVIVLGLGIVAIFLIEAEKLYNLFSKVFESFDGIENFRRILFLFILIGAIIIGVLIYIRKKDFENPVLKRITEFINDMVSTVLRTFKIKRYPYFLLLTVLIWLALAIMNYCFLLSLPITEDYTFMFAVIILFIGGIGWAIPTPGGIGSTHFIILQLFIAYNLSETAGLSYGILSNGITILLTIFFGFLAWIVWKIRNKDLPKVELK
jgi:glycosyltransferase 2 family protein